MSACVQFLCEAAPDYLQVTVINGVLLGVASTPHGQSCMVRLPTLLTSWAVAAYSGQTADGMIKSWSSVDNMK